MKINGHQLVKSGITVVVTEEVKTELNYRHILEVKMLRFVAVLDVEYEVKETL